MSTTFATLLSLHVILGLIGVMASFAAAFMLLKSELALGFLKRVSLLAFLSYLTSWFTGGWYYWKYYGSVVKPKIMGGDYTWAHAVFTESKEHVFLFLPFAAFALFLLIYTHGEALRNDVLLKKRVSTLALIITFIGAVITLSGVLITGGAR